MFWDAKAARDPVKLILDRRCPAGIKSGHPPPQETAVSDYRSRIYLSVVEVGNAGFDKSCLERG